MSSRLGVGYTPAIPATQDVEIRRIKVVGQPRQKVSQTPILTNNPGMVVCVYNPSYLGGIGRRITVWGWLQAKM
jgi:hypothetical protein